MAETNDVSNKSGAYLKMAPMWSMINTLLGGTGAMRAAGKVYLPQYPGENDDNYKARLARAVLYNAYFETSKKMTNKPFSKPLTINGVHASIKEFMDDVDLQGHDLHKFAREVFGDGLNHGYTAILLDFPVVDQAQVQTKADEDALKIRPYMVHVKAENIIAAYTDVVNGREILTHVRIAECEVKRVGFEEVMTERIRVLEPGTVTIWEKVKDKWQKGSTVSTRLKYIPMVFYYTNREGCCLANPPLLDLAYKNVEHWQSSSDQRNCMTVARFPILAASGVTLEEGKKVIGPRSLLRCSDATGKFYYVEHSGAALNVGKEDLDTLKEEMSMMGIQLIRKPQATGKETATKTQHDAEAQHSDLEAMVIDLEDTLEEALEIMVDWATPSGSGTKGDLEVEAGEIEIFKDFSISAREGADLDFLFKMRTAREISHEAFIAEVKRRSVLSDSFDMEADQEILDTEKPAMPTPAPSKGVPGTPAAPGQDGKVAPVVPPEKAAPKVPAKPKAGE
jgi:hypothetical protein